MKLEVARTHQPWPGVILRAGDYFGDVPEAIGEALTRRGWFREPKKKGAIKAVIEPVAIDNAIAATADEEPKKRGK